MSKTSATPVIGCNVVEHHSADQYHNNWFFINDNNECITDPQLLSKVDVSIKFGYLVLRAEGMLRFDIPLDVIEDDDSVRTVAKVGDQEVDVVDEGDVAAVWASKCLGQNSRIVKVHPEAKPFKLP